MRKLAIAAAVAAATISTATIAAVIFDPVSGTGWVGKGDVQLAFGWNNKSAQDNVNKVAFSAVSQAHYMVTCEWTTGPEHNRRVHEVTHPVHRRVGSTVAYQARSTGQWTGYTLTGLGSTIGNATVPAVNDPCPNGNSGIITEVTGGDTVGSAATLYVSFDGGTPVALN